MISLLKTITNLYFFVFQKISQSAVVTNLPLKMVAYIASGTESVMSPVTPGTVPEVQMNTGLNNANRYLLTLVPTPDSFAV